MTMYVTIQFDKDVDPDKHYISPGEYEMEFDNGKIVRFDFMESCGIVDREDMTLTHYRMKYITDVVEEGDTDFLHDFNGRITEVLEFYVFTESDEEEDVITPVKLVALELFNDNCGLIDISPEVLASANIATR